MKVEFEMSFVIFFSIFCLYDTALVNIEIGNDTFAIKGRTLSVLGKTIYHFSKIPYAKPPIGNRRFRYPEELDLPPWHGIYNSTDPPPTCWQSNPSTEFESENPAAKMWFSKTIMSEDCLYLTIWTPSIGDLPQSLPVMIWIYGGSYMSGSNTLEVYDGSILASLHNIVIVSFQFRIGPFGFLFMDDNESPGNQALMDQYMVFKWVKKHIKMFGGNPNSVTLFGESSGATSISLHLFSSLTNSLFHRVILQSGTIFSPWAIESPASSLVKGKYLAERANCTRYRNRETMKCLKRLSPEMIVKLNSEIRNQIAQFRKTKLYGLGYSDFYSEGAMFFDIYFRPIFDEKLISKSYIEQVSEGRRTLNKDILVGTNTNEATFFLMYGLSGFKFFNRTTVNLPPKMNFPSQEYIDPYKIVLENILDLDYMFPSLAMLILYEYDVKSTRFDDKSWNATELLGKLDNIGGDTQFICPTIQFADSVLKSRSTKLYMYRFNSRTSTIPISEWVGVMHGYEIEYVFGMPFSNRFNELYYRFNDEEKRISKLIMSMWTNFAKFGNPTPNEFRESVPWPLYTNRDKRYLEISNKDNGGITVKTNFKEKRCKFWAKVLPELRNNLLKLSNGCSIILNYNLWNTWILKAISSLLALQLAISD